MSINNILPAIPVRGLVPLPHNEFRIEIGRAQSIQALETSENDFGSYVVLLIQPNPQIEDTKPEDLSPIAILAQITLKIKLPNNNFKIKCNLFKRVSVKNYVSLEPFFQVEYDSLKEPKSNVDEEQALCKMIAEQVIPQAPNLFIDPNLVLKTIQTGTTPDVLADVVAFNLKTVEGSKVKYVEELDICKRLTMILNDVNYEKNIINLENKINATVKKNMDESQKEYYLREKMKAIQTELGDKAKREEDIEKMRERITKAKMPKHIEEKALVELRRYQETPSQMADSQILKNYLEFLIDLPWSESSVDNDSLSDAMAELDKNHYGLEKVKERIIEYLAVKIMTKKNPQTILCLVGPPGVGKTSLVMSIANALGRKFVKQSLGGVKDESEIRGHRRTYIGALPGRILKGMHGAKTINPVFLLDEIDKMASDYKGDPASAMLEVLDPEQNHEFSDHYVEEAYDLSQVLFITTANYIENIPPALKDRMEIVDVSSYTRFEKFNIAKTHLLNKQLELHGITANEFSITDDAIFHIIEHYTREAGVRELKRVLATLVRKSIKEILISKVKNVSVTVDNIESYLGIAKFTNSITHKEDQVGVVTGLAYTSFGGDILDIEATYYPGKGGLILTGKLGDVMKESAQTALSFVKSKAKDFGIDMELFSKNDIHIHVPEGAVPKDGPSAGVTMTTAIVSCLTGKKVSRNIGMTGEVTLHGTVLPIGGLREKSIAAHRSGLKTILIPKDNEKDIVEVPKEVLQDLKIIPVGNVLEVLKLAIL